MSLSEQHRGAVAVELRRRLQLPSSFVVSDDDLLRDTEGTLLRAGAELRVASRPILDDLKRDTETLCTWLEGWLRRLRG